jgi:hypothetical protein
MASGDRADGRADLYAVGVILFEMATGRRPFDDKDTIALLQAHVSRRPPSPREVAPDANLPVALVGFLQRALEKRPADRFPTALAMIEALDAVAKAPKPTPREQWAVPREPPARRPEGIASNTSAVRRILAPVPLARDLRLWAAGALLLVVPLALWWTFRTRPADELALPPPRQEVEQLPLPALEHGTCLQRRAVLARVVEGGNRALLPQLRALRDRHRADSCMGPPLRDAVQRLERR